MNNSYKLSIIIPSYNEELNIKNVIDSIIEYSIITNNLFEIIVIDDGSTDRTFEISSEIAKKNCNIKVYKHDYNKGYGAAFWTGVLNAQGEYIVVIPGDGEGIVHETVYGIILLNDVDFVIPYIYNKENRSFSRRIISYLFTEIINLTFNTRLNYTNGSVIYKTSILRKIKLESRGFFFQTEILLRLIKSGYLYAEIPTFLSRRSTGVSKALSRLSLYNVVRDYLKTIYGIYIYKNYLIDIDKESITFKKNKYLK